MSRGRPKSVSDQELLENIDSSEAPVVTAKQLSECVDLTRQAVHERLITLHQDDFIHRATLGERVVVWWLPDD